jgi:hypothetical protein
MRRVRLPRYETPGSNVGRTFRSSLRSTSVASRCLRAHSAARANCDSATVSVGVSSSSRPMPVDRGAIELVGPYVGQQFEVVEREEQRGSPHFAERELGLDKGLGGRRQRL